MDLRVGDFRDHLPALRALPIKLMLTDPPYNIGFKNYDVYDDCLPDGEYMQLLRQAANTGAASIFIMPPLTAMRYLVPALGTPMHVGAWCYNSNIPNQFRLINYYFIKPDYTRERQPYKEDSKKTRAMKAKGYEGARLYEWWDDIQLVKNVSKEKAHPCPIPLRLAERLVRLCSEPGDLIFDPFMGSGTVAVACARLGRAFVGCELSAAYAAEAERRVAEAQRDKKDGARLESNEITCSGFVTAPRYAPSPQV